MKRLFFALYLTLFANRFFYRFNKALAVTGLKGMGILNYESFAESGEDHLIQLIARRYTPQTVFDVGANIGIYSKKCLAAFPGSRLYAFEPHPASHKKYLENVKNERVRSFNLGLSDMVGSHILFDYAGHEGSSHASLHQESLEFDTKGQTTRHEVTVTTLDDFVMHESIDKIDFMKIDTEGHECNVLKGALASIRQGRITIIQFEFGRPHLASRTYFQDIYELLKDQYDLYRLLPKSLLPVRSYHYLFNEIFAFQNYVAVLKSENRFEK